MKDKTIEAAIIVAHPDDETIWTGGTILMHPECEWTIVSLCRANDPDRAPKFRKATIELGGTGFIGDLDDAPNQKHLPDKVVEKGVLQLLPKKEFDLVITHNPHGEYTRHHRHEQIGEVILNLWEHKRIRSSEIWLFAYADSGKGGIEDVPQPISEAHSIIQIPQDIWQRKKNIITEIYGFGPNSYETAICQQNEAFWIFRSITELKKWRKSKGGRK